MNKEFLDALTELEREKNISKEDIITAIEDAVELAYKKNYGNYPNVRVSVDREDGEVLVRGCRGRHDGGFPRGGQILRLQI